MQDGAQEVDVVFPYARYLAGERHYAHTFVAACKAVCGDNVTLKVILETGALATLQSLPMPHTMYYSGRRFHQNIHRQANRRRNPRSRRHHAASHPPHRPQLKHHVGLKVSGGIRTIEQAAQYIALADQIMGRDWVTPQTFRIGASKLVDEALANI